MVESVTARQLEKPYQCGLFGTLWSLHQVNICVSSIEIKSVTYDPEHDEDEYDPNQPIEIVLKIDNDVVARQLLSNNFVGKAKTLSYTKGSDRLSSNATINQSGGSNEISDMG